MQTVLSHIVQRRFSRQNENIATDALTFILSNDSGARAAFNTLIRQAVPSMPELRFREQVTEATSRPDMWGYDLTDPRVYIENKFWAGLTPNQPNSYIRQLSQHNQPTLLLFIAPPSREHALWRELLRRCQEEGVTTRPAERRGAFSHLMDTDAGPFVALTSWPDVLSVLEAGATEEPTSTDIIQLRSLCDAADDDLILSTEDLTNQVTPALILQLGRIVERALDLAALRNVISKRGVVTQADYNRTGRYVRWSDSANSGAWIGTHYRYWKDYGQSPIWCVLSTTDFGRSRELRAFLADWANVDGLRLAIESDDTLAVPFPMLTGQDNEEVVEDLVRRLEQLANGIKSTLGI